MRQAKILVNNEVVGILYEMNERQYRFTYEPDYQGSPVSLTMPVRNNEYEFTSFPPFFEGLLPEGILLESLLRKYKIDRNDYFGQLMKVGNDLVGAVNVEEIL